MNLNHLRAFVTVAETLSFSRAAKRLYVSQPALSKQIQQLEEDLGAQLFVRSRSSVTLSDVGKAVVEDAERLLVQVDEFRSNVLRGSRGAKGMLKMGFVVSAMEEIVPGIAVEFRKRHPDVSLELRNIPTVSQVEALRQRQLDVGIVRLPLRENDMEVLPLSSEPFAIVFSKQHPLKAVKGVTVKDLSAEGFVAYSERLAPEFFQHWTSLCRKAGFTPHIVQEVAEMQTALGLVAAGVGVAILPYGMARRHARSLVVIPLKSEKIRSEIGIVLLKWNASHLAKALVDSAVATGTLTTRPRRRTA